MRRGVIFISFFSLAQASVAFALKIDQLPFSSNIEDRRTGLLQLVDRFVQAGNHLRSFQDQFQKGAPPGIDGSCVVISSDEYKIYQKAIQAMESKKGQEALGSIRRLVKDPNLLDVKNKNNSNSRQLPGLDSVDSCSGAFELNEESALAQAKKYEAANDGFEIAFADVRSVSFLLRNLENPNIQMPKATLACDFLRKKIRKQMGETVKPLDTTYKQLSSRMSFSTLLMSQYYQEAKKVKNKANCGSVGSKRETSSSSTLTSP